MLDMPCGLRLDLRKFLLAFGLVSAGFAPLPLAAQDEPAARPPGGARLIHQNTRAFRIPINIKEADFPRIREVRLFVSSDQGATWSIAGQVPPDRKSITFEAPRDGEYWFAVGTQDTRGRNYPSDDTPVEPRIRVVVDTTPPTVSLNAKGRRGERVRVIWEIKDRNLDPSTLVLSYRAEGSPDWRNVPDLRPSLIGAQEWNAGTGAPLEIRATVEDMAHNPGSTVINVAAGVAAPSDSDAVDDRNFGPPPPIAPISAASLANGAAGGFGDNASYAPAAPAFSDRDFGPANDYGPDSGFGAGGSRSTRATRQRPAETGSTPGAIAPGAIEPDTEPLYVNNPRFELKYGIDNVGRHGPALVEMYVSRDGGRSWMPMPEDADRQSPYPLDLGSEGTFGLWLVVQSASGLGDRPPQPGDKPLQWVVVDTTPPALQLDPPLVGRGPALGKVKITWQAADPHMAERPVLLSYRNADEPGAEWIPIGDRIDNTGRFVWDVPENTPPRLHLRIDIVDRLLNRAWAETTTSGNPIVVDRSRPRGRILGLDSGPQTGPAATERR
jgi:hypothetical protein